jgi:hypothetical protein
LNGPSNLLSDGTPPSPTRSVALDRRDLAVIAVLYLAVVGLWRLAFTGFTATVGSACS